MTPQPDPFTDAEVEAAANQLMTFCPGIVMPGFASDLARRALSAAAGVRGDELIHVGYQWVDDIPGNVSGGLLPLDTTLVGDSRCIPVYRKRGSGG